MSAIYPFQTPFPLVLNVAWEAGITLGEDTELWERSDRLKATQFLRDKVQNPILDLRLQIAHVTCCKSGGVL